MLIRNSFFRNSISFLSRFRRESGGAVAVISALLAIPIIVIGSSGVDLSHVLKERRKLQSAVDSAALAAAHNEVGIPSKQRQDEITAEVIDMVRRIYSPDDPDKVREVVVEFRETGEGMDVTARIGVELFFLPLIGFDEYPVSVESGVHFQDGATHIVLVLDNSSSMGQRGRGGKSMLEELKDAVVTFNRVLIEGMEASHRSAETFKIGFVPFAAAVNVGSQYRNASWMDGSTLSPIHWQYHFDRKVSRFSLYDRLGVDWYGCVEVRPQPYDVHDYYISPEKLSPRDSLPQDRNARFFVPWFRADEPDYNVTHGDRDMTVLDVFDRDYTAYLRYLHKVPGVPRDENAPVGSRSNYLPDQVPYDRYRDQHGGPSAYGSIRDYPTARTRWFERMKNIDKYEKASMRMKHGGGGLYSDPNEGCSERLGSRPIQPLVSSLDVLIDYAKNLKVAGSLTNILDGLGWGWRVLSPGEPFTESAVGAAGKDRRVLILLSDGKNTVVNLSDNPVLGKYSAFGYPYENRQNIDPAIYKGAIDSGRSADYDNYKRSYGARRSENIDERTAEICENIKKDGVILYTIAFGTQALNDQDLRKMLSKCATTEDHFFPVERSVLEETFVQLAGELKKLHLDR